MAPGPDPLVSVVIPTQGNRPDILTLAVARLAAEPCVAQIVVAADPAAGRPLPQEVQRTALVVGARGGGPNSSRQTGLDAASEEVVLFLDDDVLPDAGLAAGHAAHHARAELRVVVGYMPVARDGTGRYETATSELYGQEYERRVGAYERDPKAILRNLWGGNVSLRRVDALRVGVENSAHPGRRHEDQDFGLRCAAAGLEGVFDRDLRALHHYRRSRGAFLRDAWAQGYERAVLRQNEPGSEWFTSAGGGRAERRPDTSGAGGLRRAELVSLKAARRLQLWRGSGRARRDMDKQRGH